MFFSHPLSVDVKPQSRSNRALRSWHPKVVKRQCTMSPSPSRSPIFLKSSATSFPFSAVAQELSSFTQKVIRLQKRHNYQVPSHQPQKKMTPSWGGAGPRTPHWTPQRILLPKLFTGLASSQLFVKSSGPFPFFEMLKAWHLCCQGSQRQKQLCLVGHWDLSLQCSTSTLFYWFLGAKKIAR